MVLGFKSGIAVGVIGSICCAKLIFKKIAKDYVEAYIDRTYSNFANELAIKFNDSITEIPTEDTIDKCAEKAAENAINSTIDDIKKKFREEDE